MVNSAYPTFGTLPVLPWRHSAFRQLALEGTRRPKRPIMDADSAYSRLAGAVEVEGVKGEKEKPQKVIDQASYESMIGLNWEDYKPDLPSSAKRPQGGATPTGGITKRSRRGSQSPTPPPTVVTIDEASSSASDPTDVQYPSGGNSVQAGPPPHRVAAPVRRSNSDPTAYNHFSAPAQSSNADAAITGVVIQDLTGCYSIESQRVSHASPVDEDTLSSIDDFLQQQGPSAAEDIRPTNRETAEEAGLRLLNTDDDEAGRFSPTE